MVDSCLFLLLSILEARSISWYREEAAMKLYWLAVRVVMSYLLVKMGIDTGMWIAAILGLLVGFSSLSDFLLRLSRAVETMRE